MDSRTLYVAFDGSQVAVRSTLPEVLAAVERRYRKMLEQEPARLVARLLVRSNGGGYRFRSHGFEVRVRTLQDLAEQLSYHVALGLIEANSHRLWLHAGAAAREGRAVLFAAASGCGKSTLVARLYERGWDYLSDDIVPLDLETGRAGTFPRALEVREHPGHELAPDGLRGLPKVLVEVTGERVAWSPTPLEALIFPAYAPGAPAELRRCSPGEAVLRLLQSCMNFTHHRERAVQCLCGLLERLPAYHLRFSSGSLAAEAIEEILLCSRPAVRLHRTASEDRSCGQR